MGKYDSFSTPLPKYLKVLCLQVFATIFPPYTIIPHIRYHFNIGNVITVSVRTIMFIVMYMQPLLFYLLLNKKNKSITHNFCFSECNKRFSTKPFNENQWFWMNFSHSGYEMILVYHKYLQTTHMDLLTINQNNWFFNGSLVMVLWFNKRKAKKTTNIWALVPSNMIMVNIDTPQPSHHV